ncbi:MAG: DEAD/DEAH box helicase [Acetivibrionales bacterium]|mgnify:FL=1|jgi:DEAD/DEAH box helicase domain-containing protein|nr:DEAD/DEAH box helicase [Clostridiales bacterium]HPZ05319.1 DEAD/DEAH box helicase [Clostridiales bacterium]HQD31613.1 DEAD/DEAH box helicase [Clostridiales bacterium]
MNIEQMLEHIRASEKMMKNITAWVELPAKEAVYADFPDFLDERITKALERRGVRQLYSHQASAVRAVHDGKSIVVVTPTASGKTMCYNVPVMDAILKDESSRALFLFPTKALSQDQTAELHELITEAGVDVKTYTYDGDTPQSARKAIRQAGHIVVTNPDMLHSGILPHHTKWTKLFENLKFVVIDEVHHYRGVFGSHLANVIRRLRRICDFYGSKPQFICCSATIANPVELASRIIGEDVELIDNNGAPTASKHFIFYNPPVINRELGIRRSSMLEAKRIAESFIRNEIQTILFTRSRLNVEVLVTYLRNIYGGKSEGEKRVRGYRGGYLPTLRREIEKGLREGSITGVVSTNALELGIDIGALDACVICGYPGTIASTWQQAGRAGRRSGVSVAILVASSSPLDQYIINNPDYFFGKTPENGLINPDNLVILYSHMKCAAFELPFEDGEKFGVETTAEILGFMEDARLVRHVGNRWHWMADVFPADEISLRSASNENFIIIDITEPKPVVIGETDRFSAPMLLHEEAIYIHEGVQYQVEELDFDDKKAYVRRVNVDYYTDANLAVDLKVLDVFREDKTRQVHRSCGEVSVSALVTMFKKIKLHTHENIGSGPVTLPELEMHTTSYWVSLPGDMPDMSQTEQENGLLGLSNVLANAAPIYLMCSPGDIRVVHQVRAPFTQRPTVYIYDSYPGGVGFSDKLYELHRELFETAASMVEKCGCESGCPSCVGPLNEFTGADDPKELTLRLIELIRQNA